MNTLKIIITSVFLCLLTATFAVALLGAVGIIKLDSGALQNFFLVLGLELCAVITAVFRTHDFFKDDPNSLKNEKTRHSEEMRDLEAFYGNKMTEREEGFQEVISSLETSNSHLKRENTELKSEVYQLKARLNPKPRSPIASGDAHTRQKQNDG